MTEENRAQREALQRERRHLEIRQREAEEMQAALAERERELRSSGLREKLRDVEQARREIRQIVQEVKNAPSDGKLVVEARKKLETHRKRLHDEDVGNEEQGRQDAGAAARKIRCGALPPETGLSWTAAVSEVQSTTLDLRGMHGDEAIGAVERFLDTMSLNRIRQVTITHGKGTGSLRRKTAECFRRHRAVESFQLGEWGEGGAGVTVVLLKN